MSHNNPNKIKPKILFVGSFLDESIRPERGGMLASCTYLINSRLNTLVDFILFDSTNATVPVPSIYSRILSGIARQARFIKTLIFKTPDVVLIYSSGGLSFIEKGVLVLISKIFLKPVIWSIRSGVFVDQIDNSKSFKFFANFFLQFPNIMICQGETAATAFKKRLRIDPNKIQVISNWIEPTKFLEIPERPVKNFESEEFNLLFVGWVNRAKGIFELIDVISDIDNEKIKVRLDIVGKGEEFDEAVKKATSLNQINKSIYFHEWLSGNKLLERFKAADTLVLPTYAEGFPNVILEAMAAGLPIITTPVGSITDVIKHERNGLIIEPKNRTSLKNAILSLRNNPKLCLEMGETNKTQVVNNHGIEKQSSKIWEIVQKLFNNR